MNYCINLEWKPKFRWKDEHECIDCNEKGGGSKSLLDTHHFDGQHLTSGNIDVVLVESPNKEAMALKINCATTNLEHNTSLALLACHAAVSGAAAVSSISTSVVASATMVSLS